MANEVKIKLTDEQKAKIKEETGHDIPEVHVASLGSNAPIAPAVAPRLASKASPRMMARKAAPRLAVKKASPRLAVRKAAPRLAVKKAAPRFSARRGVSDDSI